MEHGLAGIVALLSRYQETVEIVASVTLITTGLYLLNEYFFIIQH